MPDVYFDRNYSYPTLNKLHYSTTLQSQIIVLKKHIYPNQELI